MRGKFAYYWDIFGPYGYASMRPAHYAREVSFRMTPSFWTSFSFNEARALCAGSCRNTLLQQAANRVASMRPAHYAREVSQDPETQYVPCNASMRPAHYAREVSQDPETQYVPCNASMRPAHYAREVGSPFAAYCAATSASMRPAHYAREVRRRDAHHRSTVHSFNEARALCAGSWPSRPRPRPPASRFNEARALCAGS